MVKDFTYWNNVADAASVAAFRREEIIEGRISAEAQPENESIIDFKTFAQDYPEKFFPLLSNMRAEFQELCIEYYILEKAQSFLAKVHGQIQTRIWQNLRVIEKGFCAMLVLGPAPDRTTMMKILKVEGLEQADDSFGLSLMIANYACTQSYPQVAAMAGIPAPAVRKLFRPAMDKLAASKNLRAVALGSYLRAITHQASLTDIGLSKRCVARLNRIKRATFEAPEPETSPLISVGNVASLRDTPWNMFEISSDHQVAKIIPIIRKNPKRVFGPKTAAQVFAPTSDDGDLQLGYLLARSSNPTATKSLLRIRGISEIAGRYNEQGICTKATVVPHADVKPMIDSFVAPIVDSVKVGDFVEVLTGDASRYCGTVSKISDSSIVVQIEFPSGRRFMIYAQPGSLKKLPVPVEKQAFWGSKP